VCVVHLEPKIHGAFKLHSHISNVHDNCIQCIYGSVCSHGGFWRGVLSLFIFEYKMQGQQAKRNGEKQFCYVHEVLKLKLLTIALQKCVCVYWDCVQRP
jgi:hypothetical protein